MTTTRTRTKDRPPRAIHVVPVDADYKHRPSEQCGCHPRPDAIDCATLAQVFTHRDPSPTVVRRVQR